jgi:predicted ATPase
LLVSARLVTLTGAGGVGKTRLAIEVGRHLVAVAADRVRFVPLAGVETPDLLASTIAVSVGLTLSGISQPQLQLFQYLHYKRLVLVLDNFEHLIDGAGLLTAILNQAPQVTILVTSRVRLNLEQERVFPVTGLAYPGPRENEPAGQFSAVQLFSQQAQQVQPAFSVEENLNSIVEVCRLTEGLPLALELAATWVRVMPCNQIARQIERSLDFLKTPFRDVPERHRSLRAVFDRSWSLLSEPERQALAMLSVFRGGFDADAAQVVCGASIDMLAGLVDKSLVLAVPPDRYDLHELVRQYLSQKLSEVGEPLILARRHFDFYLQLATQAESQLYGPDQETWFDRLDLDSKNLGAALAWSISEKEAAAGLRLAAALAHFWEHRSYFHQGHSWFERLLAIPVEVHVEVRAKALRTAGVMAVYAGDLPLAMALCEEGLRIARDANDQWNYAWDLASLGFIKEKMWLDPGPALNDLEEALRLFRDLRDGWGMSHCLRRLGWFYTSLGEYDRATTLLEEALTQARKAGNQHAMAWSLFLFGRVIWLRDRDSERAATLLNECLSLVRQTRDRHNLIYVLVALGQVADARGNADEAHARYGAVAALFREQGGLDYQTMDVSPFIFALAHFALRRGRPDRAAQLFGATSAALSRPYLTFGDRHDIDSDIDATRQQLGEVAFAQAYAAGQRLSMEDAIAIDRENHV